LLGWNPSTAWPDASGARLLPRGAAAAHVQLSAAGQHDHTIVVRPRRARVGVRLHLPQRRARGLSAPARRVPHRKQQQHQGTLAVSGASSYNYCWPPAPNSTPAFRVPCLRNPTPLGPAARTPRARACSGAAGERGLPARLDVVDVLVAVRLLPHLLDDLVDVRHLVGVERQQRLLQRLRGPAAVGGRGLPTASRGVGRACGTGSRARSSQRLASHISSGLAAAPAYVLCAVHEGGWRETRPARAARDLPATSHPQVSRSSSF